MQWFKNIFGLFYPKFCCGCGEVLPNQTTVLCEDCLLQLDFIPPTKEIDTQMKRRFYGKLLTNHCVSTLYFTEESISQQLLHHLKYKNQPQISEFLAILTLQHLEKHSVFSWADCIVPVPLHPSKEKTRGYNQLDGFGTHLSKHLKIPYLKSYLMKQTKSNSQTRKNIVERAKNADEFIVNPKYKALQQKNILLIDDVMTTGSTLETAGNCILKNSSNKISILTMAYTR